jgi:hypothetical protein
MNENREMVLTGVNVKGKKHTPSTTVHSTKNISTQVWKVLFNTNS